MTDTTSRRPPRDVTYAFWLLILIAVLGVGAAMVNLFSIDKVTATMQRQAAERRITVDPAALAAGAQSAVVTAVIVSAVFAVLSVVFAVRMRQGQNWARLLLTALSAFSILMSLPRLGSGDPWALVQVVLAGAAIALMYRPAAKEYFSPQAPVTDG